MSEPFILMHISDLHFHRLALNPTVYLSKRALGGLNLLLRRRWVHPLARAQRLVAALEAAEWSHLVITGDMTQLALPAEFALARRILAPLLARGPEHVTVLPGNHDRYVRETREPRAFEAAFGEFAPRGGLLTRQLTGHWHLAAWDSTETAPWLSAAGRVPPETLAATQAWLAGLPSGARVILASHYPLHFPPPHHYRAHHDLRNQEEVRAWLEAQPIDLFLHGHIHHPWLMRVERPGRPLTAVNSASSTRIPHPGTTTAYHRIVLQGETFQVQPMSLA